MNFAEEQRWLEEELIGALFEDILVFKTHDIRIVEGEPRIVKTARGRWADAMPAYYGSRPVEFLAENPDWQPPMGYDEP